MKILALFAIARALASVNGSTAPNDGWRRLNANSCADLSAVGAMDVVDALTWHAHVAHGSDYGNTEGDDAPEISDILSLLSAFGSESCPGEWRANTINFRRGFHHLCGETDVGFGDKDRGTELSSDFGTADAANAGRSK